MHGSSLGIVALALLSLAACSSESGGGTGGEASSVGGDPSSVGSSTGGDSSSASDSSSTSESTSTGDPSSTSGSNSTGAGGATTGSGGGTSCTESELAALETEMAMLLDQAATDPSVSSLADYTLMLERDDGHSFVHSNGSSTPTTSYESASTSKWVTAVVLLDLVDAGEFTLSTTVSSRLPLLWKEDTVTLEHLLSFRSGFADEPACIHLANANFKDCVALIYSNNALIAPAAGTQFYYSATHLQVAGMMAINSVTGAASWSDIFAAFKTKTGLFPSSVYDLPSAENPRLAGGMHWTADDYFGFLRALYRGNLLSDASRQTLFENHRASASVAYSPAIESLDEDWAYGLGHWLECPEAQGGTEFNCASGGRNSSPGAYGSYPFIDFEHGYFGILARQGEIGTFPEGVAMFRSIESLAAKWATNDCSQ